MTAAGVVVRMIVLVMVVPAAARPTVVMIVLGMGGDAQMQAVALDAVPMMAVPGIVSVAVIVALLHAPLRLERPRHDPNRGAEPPTELSHRRAVLDIDCIARDLGSNPPVADVPGDPSEAAWRRGADLEQGLGRSNDLDQPPILEPEGIAPLDGGRLVQIEKELRSFGASQDHATTMAVGALKDDGVGDPFRLDGEPADDGGCADHGASRGAESSAVASVAFFGSAAQVSPAKIRVGTAPVAGPKRGRS